MSSEKKRRQLFSYDLQNSNDPDFFRSQPAEGIPRQTCPYPDPQTTGRGRISDAIWTTAADDFQLVQLRPVIPPLDLSTAGPSLYPCSSSSSSSSTSLPRQFVNDQRTLGSCLDEETAHEKTPLNGMHQQQRNQFDLMADHSGDNSFEDFTKNLSKRRSFEEAQSAEGMEATHQQKNSIDRLRKLLEKRQKESRPTSRIRGAAAALLRQEDRTSKDAEFCKDAVCCSSNSIVVQRRSDSTETVSSFVDFPSEAKFSHLNPLVKQNFNPEEPSSDNRLQMEPRNAEILEKNARTPSSIDSQSSSLQRSISVNESTLHHSANHEEFPHVTTPFPTVTGFSDVIRSQRPEDQETNRRATNRHRVSPNTGSMTEEVETRRRPLSSSSSFDGNAFPHCHSASSPKDAGLLFHGKEKIRRIGDPPMEESGSLREEGKMKSHSLDHSTDSSEYRNIPIIIESNRLNDDDGDVTSSPATEEGGSGKTQPEAPSDPSNPTPRSPSPGILLHLAMAAAAASGKSSSAALIPTSTDLQDPDTKMKENGVINTDAHESDADSAIPCRICHDVANGFHYGVWSCEGCKAFFKRSITGSARYVCPADDSCTINRLRKKSCQSCRLRKCFDLGMSSGKCRVENGNKYARKMRLLEDQFNRRTLTENDKKCSYDRMTTTTLEVGCSDREDHVTDLPEEFFRPSTSTEGSSHRQRNLRSLKSDSVISILDHLMTIERPIRYADCDEGERVNAHRSPTPPPPHPRVIASLMKLVNAQLMDIVNWSFNLPGFKDLDIDVSNQVLVGSWSEILLLTNAFHSLHSPGVFVMAPNLHLTRETSEAMGMESFYVRLMRLVRDLRHLELSHGQLLLLQAIVLINTDFSMPLKFPQLEELLSDLLIALSELRPSSARAAGRQQGSSSNSSVGQLLLVLPQLKHCGLQFLSILSEVSMDKRLNSTYGLLQDIIDNRRRIEQISILERNEDGKVKIRR